MARTPRNHASCRPRPKPSSDHLHTAARIDIVLAVREEPVGDGWLRAGGVADDVEAAILTVYWHPDTDRVKIDRPPDPNAISTPIPVGRPGPTVSLGVRRAYRASPGYRYFLDGVEHSPEEAERIVQERDSLAGWTWRPRSP
jgi:hypothetical protein